MNWPQIYRWLKGPGQAPAAWVLAVGLFCSPKQWSDPVKAWVQQALRPGVVVADRAVTWGSDAKRWATGAVASAEKVAQLERELEQLRNERNEWQAKFDALTVAACWAKQELEDKQNGAEDLLKVDGLEARVLGTQAYAWLTPEELLDVGHSQGVKEDALVVQGNRFLVDQGEQTGAKLGDRVLLGASVLGRLKTVGRHTSVVQRVTAPQFRDVVQLARLDGTKIQLGPQGLLAGTGDGCEVRLVEVSQPVSVGDLVLAAGTEGLSTWPLVYGKVSQVKYPAGGFYCQITVEPAVHFSFDRVTILRVSRPSP